MVRVTRTSSTVAGNADLGGASVEVVPGAGSYLMPVEVTILTAGSIDGVFADFGPDFAFLTITPEIGDLTSVLLTIERNDAGLGQYAQTPNQSTIAAALEEARIEGNDTYSDDLETVFESLDVLTVDQVPSVLDAMTGETLTQFATARLATAQRFGRSLDARIREYQWDTNDAIITAGTEAGEASHLTADSVGTESGPILGVAMLGVGPMGAPGVGTTANEDPLLRAWIDGSGIYGDVDGNSNESAFDYTIWGGSLGADLRLAEHWVLGLAGGYANTDLDFSSRPGEGDIDTFQGALYAGYVDPRFHVGVSGRYAHNDMDGTREIGFGLNRKASADLDGDDYGARFRERTQSTRHRRDRSSTYRLSRLQPSHPGRRHRERCGVVESRDRRQRPRFPGPGRRNARPTGVGRSQKISGSCRSCTVAGCTSFSTPTGSSKRGWSAVRSATASAFQIQGAELPRDSGSVGVAWNVITESAWSIIGSYDAILNEDLVQHVGSITLSFEW